MHKNQIGRNAFGCNKEDIWCILEKERKGEENENCRLST